jgi:hypothetical protein
VPLSLTPGKKIRRGALHERYGGRRQGGISPSAKTPNVFIITAPTGKQHGYIYDGFNADDGYYHYTGEGRYGDQQMVQGNRAIRDHVREGRELHLFTATGPQLTYVGPFQYVSYYDADAPESGGGETRKVIVFRLKQVAGVAPPENPVDLLPPKRTTVEKVPIERQHTEATWVDRDREPYEARRAEQDLVLVFEDWLIAQGHKVYRFKLRPKGEPAPLLCDVYDETTNTLFEAKGSIARPAIRMAIGQLADYSRLIKSEPSKAVLLPERPRADLLALLRNEQIAVWWRDGEAFQTSDA